MNIFNFRHSNKENGLESINNQSVAEDTPIVDNQDDNPNGASDNENNYITITWGTGEPIDVIFNYIHQDMEEQGYNDAIVNPDMTYKEAKENIIKNDLMMLFRRITLRYNDCIRKVDAQISRAESAFLTSNVELLNLKKQTFEEHLSEIQDMERMLHEGDPKMTTMIETYKRGFIKGIAAQTEQFINHS